MYEQALVLAYISAALIVGMIGYDLHLARRKKLIAVRRKALDDAFDALASLENVASRAADRALDESPPRSAAFAASRVRASCYGRAKMIVASIPVDRL